MARISKAEYPRILELVDVEKRKVAEVAFLYGCTPANIYALVGKLRRAGVGAATADDADTTTVAPTMPELALDRVSPSSAGASELPGIRERSTASATEAPELSERADKLAGSSLDLVINETIQGPKIDAVITAPLPRRSIESPPAPTSRVSASSSKNPVKIMKLLKREVVTGKDGVGSAPAKPGFGLAMRTAEGDENVTPFCLLDDLLSAVKPILRAAARSPDAVWFSIQSIDLSTLESDVA